MEKQVKNRFQHTTKKFKKDNQAQVEEKLTKQLVGLRRGEQFDFIRLKVEDDYDTGKWPTPNLSAANMDRPSATL